MKLRRNRRPGNRAASKAERKHLDAVKRAGCVCCIARGYTPDPDNPPAVEAHHLLDGGLRIDHMHVIGACAWHHRGRLFVNGWDHAQHRLMLGPSLAEGSIPFHHTFGTDEDLLRMQTQLLGQTLEVST